MQKSNEEIEEVKQVVFNEKMESPKDKVRSPEQNMTMNQEEVSSYSLLSLKTI